MARADLDLHLKKIDDLAQEISQFVPEDNIGAQTLEQILPAYW